MYRKVSLSDEAYQKLCMVKLSEQCNLSDAVQKMYMSWGANNEKYAKLVGSLTGVTSSSKKHKNVKAHKNG